MSMVFDVAVIGSGNNGLVAANYLADAGLRVVVLEADSQVGGMTSSSASIEAAPRHVINHCAVDPIFWDAFPPSRDLELHRYGLRTVEIDPTYAYLHPDGASLAFWRDPTRTADELRRFSAADAAAYLEFSRFLDAFLDVNMPLATTNPVRPDLRSLVRVARGAARHRRSLADIGHLLVASGDEVIAERFEHPVTRAALHFLCGVFVPNSHHGTAMNFLTLAVMHRYPCRRPVGGMQAFPDALSARLRAAGGSVRTGARVAHIMVRGGRATGVALVDGTEIFAEVAVLATCDPRQALLQLLPAETLSDEMDRRVRAIPTRNHGYGMLKVDVACGGRLELERHTRWRRDGMDLRKPTHFIGTPEGLERAFNRSAAGLLPDEDDIAFWGVIPTALDPSQAPDGQDTLYLWSQTAPVEPEGGWAAMREEAGQRAIKKAAQFYDGVTDLELGRQIATHEDIARLRSSTDGSVIHVDWGLNRLGPLRPARGLGGYRTPVEGLFLGGSGSHPGGGLTGVPGHNSAREILRLHRHTGRHRK